MRKAIVLFALLSIPSIGSSESMFQGSAGKGGQPTGPVAGFAREEVLRFRSVQINTEALRRAADPVASDHTITFNPFDDESYVIEIIGRDSMGGTDFIAGRTLPESTYGTAAFSIDPNGNVVATIKVAFSHFEIEPDPATPGRHILVQVMPVLLKGGECSTTDRTSQGDHTKE